MKIFGKYYSENQTLMSIFLSFIGINFKTFLLLCSYCGISPFILVKNLSLKHKCLLEKFCSDPIVLKKSLKKQRRLNFLYFQEIGLLRAKRRNLGLPVRGQRTRSNGNTAFKKRNN